MRKFEHRKNAWGRGRGHCIFSFILCEKSVTKLQNVL